MGNWKGRLDSEKKIQPPLPDLPCEVYRHSRECGCTVKLKELQFKLQRGNALSRREYLVHEPSVYSQDTLMPLVLCLHGTDETVTDTELLVQEDDSVSWLQLSDQEKVLLVLPQSHRFEAEDDIPVSWRPVGDPMRSAWKPGEEDELFIAALLKQLQQDYPIDASCIYALGYSNGGLFLASLLLESDKFQNVFAAVCNYMGGVDPEQLRCVGVSPEAASHYCDEPCVSLIGIHQNTDCDGDATCIQQHLQKCSVAVHQHTPQEHPKEPPQLQTVFKHSSHFENYLSLSAIATTSSLQEGEDSVAAKGSTVGNATHKRMIAVSGKAPVYIVTGSRDTNRNYCYTALCAFRELKYEVFFDDLLQKSHEYQSQSTADIWTFFRMHYRCPT